MSHDAKYNAIAAAMADAEVVQLPPPEQLRLLVQTSSPDKTVVALREVLKQADRFYERGVPVEVVHDQTRGGSVFHPLTPRTVVLYAHQHSRPYARKPQRDGSIKEIDVALPDKLASMYLDWRDWQLPVLNGVASAPLLREDGIISSASGYDPETGMWRENVPDVGALVPDAPSRPDAEMALRKIRDMFCTFPFADAEMVDDPDRGVPVVNRDLPPGKDESSFLASLLTAVCRPSLPLAPGLLLRAASMSGAGAGKGLLARCISVIAFGRDPYAVAASGNTEEMDKRIAAELIEGSPTLFLDNLNNQSVKSDLLASAITERPARVRLLGASQMVPLNPSAFVMMTGNGIMVSEDLARRFLVVELDPHTEDPEARPFKGDIKAEVRERRTELLAAVLTIWRWGRQTCLTQGKAVGSFEGWSRWVRDPLLALGCKDPVERIAESKERDGARQQMAELFHVWWAKHGDAALPGKALDEVVKAILDPHGRSRQYLASRLEKLAGTRAAGFVLQRHQSPNSIYSPTLYSLKKTDSSGGPEEHGHHEADEPVRDVTPMMPMPSAVADNDDDTVYRGRL